MAEFSAIIALDGLGRLDEEIAARQQAGDHYRELFQGTGLAAVPEPTWGRSVYFKCPVLLPHDRIDMRPEIVEAISAENVSCRVPHRPLYSMPWLVEYLKEWGKLCGPGECPVVAKAHPRLFEIESGPYLPADEAARSGAAAMKVWRHFS